MNEKLDPERILHPVTTDTGKVLVYQFWCPGCKDIHTVDTHWNITGSVKHPTVAPSALTRKPMPGFNMRCHLFIKAGKLEYLNDSTHHLKGQTVDAIPWEQSPYKK